MDYSLLFHYHHHNYNSYIYYIDESSTKKESLHVLLHFFLFCPHKNSEAPITYQGSSVSENKVGIWIHVFQTAELGCMVTTFIILNYSTLYHNNVLQIIYFPIVGH